MAFLFKSKKHQDRTVTSRDGSSGSQGSIQNAPGRVGSRDEKNTALQRATPTGSLHSIDNDTNTSSPDQAQGPGHGRRGGSVDTPQTSDLPVSSPDWELMELATTLLFFVGNSGFICGN